MIGNPFVPEMPGGQSSALSIHHVINKRIHYVTGGTGADGFRLLEYRSYCARDTNDRKNEQSNQEHPMIGAPLQTLAEQKLNKNKNNNGGQGGNKPSTSDQLRC